MWLLKFLFYLFTSYCSKTITIVQFNDVPDSVVCSVIKEEKLIYGFNVRVISDVVAPDSVYMPEYDVYSGAKLLNYLESYSGYRVLGIFDGELTYWDCGRLEDLFGYGFAPPYRACEISEHNITKDFTGESAIVAIHELGHTFGLPHCWNPNCYMNEGDGTEEGMRHPYILCDSCRKKLKF